MLEIPSAVFVKSLSLLATVKYLLCRGSVLSLLKKIFIERIIMILTYKIFLIAKGSRSRVPAPTEVFKNFTVFNWDYRL